MIDYHPAVAADSALIVPIPDVERAVERYRRRYDPSAAAGVPAHVTIHFPWLPADSVNAEALGPVRDLVAETEPFAVSFFELRWFGTDVLWLAPIPDEPFRRLSLQSAQLWPEAPLYGGAFDEVTPHLTVGDLSRGGDGSGLREAENDLRTLLPLAASAAELWWLTLGRNGRWVRRSAFRFGSKDRGGNGL